jgi:putative NADH-flavin reductase
MATQQEYDKIVSQFEDVLDIMIKDAERRWVTMIVSLYMRNGSADNDTPLFRRSYQNNAKLHDHVMHKQLIEHEVSWYFISNIQENDG